MARLLLNGQGFDSLSSRAFLEREYEALIVQESRHLFPDMLVVPFTEPVVFQGVTKKPDIALIDKQLRAWWVGEVELAHHSLEGHVLPQVEVFVHGEYGVEHAEALDRHLPGFQRDALLKMVRGSQPDVVVIVNEEVPAWSEQLRREGALMVVVEVFTALAKAPAFRVDGDEVGVPSGVLTVCEVEPMLPRMLRVESPGALPRRRDPDLEIYFEGAITRWRLIETADRTYLSPRRDSPWPASGNSQIRIVQRPDGKLMFETGEASG